MGRGVESKKTYPKNNNFLKTLINFPTAKQNKINLNKQT